MELGPEHLVRVNRSRPPQVKTEKPLITPATFPRGKIFPSPFPSFFIPASLNAQQLLGPALHVPAMITSLGYWEGGWGRNPQVLWIGLLWIPTRRVLPSDFKLRDPSPAHPPFPSFSSLF